MPFSRFPPGILTFLRGIQANNNHDWFTAHKRDYQDCCLAPAKEFVETAGSAIRAFIPGIEAEAKVMGSILRMTRDTRYASADRPYKDHLDFWFWEGTRNQAVSGLFARISADFVGIGAGCHGFVRGRLRSFRDAAVDPRHGARLASAAAVIESKGYRIQGEHTKCLLKGYPVDAVAARFLRFNALYVHKDEPPEIAIRDGALLGTALRYWRDLEPLHRWITECVQFQERSR